MKVLLCGGSGLVGRVMLKVFNDEYQQHSVLGTYNNNYYNGLIKIDFLDSNSLEEKIKEINPDVCISNIAERQNETCENQWNKIKKINISLDKLNHAQLNELSKFIKPSNFKNFLNNKITGPILYENAINKYENIIERQIEKFYKVEVDYANNSGATIFNNEKDYDHLFDLFKIVFANVNLKYNLDIIYNDDDILNDFVTEELKNKPENS